MRIIKIISFIKMIFILNTILIFKIFNFENKKILSINKSILHEYLHNSENDYEYFNISNIKYTFSYKYRTIKLGYNIGFYDKNKNIILPSDLSLYNNLNVLCYVEFKTINKTYLNSLANVYQDKYFNCIEYLNFNNKADFGIKIYQTNNRKISIFILFNEKIFNYNKFFNNNNEIFELFLIYKNYLNLVKEINNKNLKLKKSFIKYPHCKYKRNILKEENKWVFANIYNKYFCFCKGKNCSGKNILESCKYFFYLYIIDNNRNIYKKTDFLFIDFIFNQFSSDDTYPIFKEMKTRNFSVHYVTENMKIYNDNCYQINKCLSILKVKKNNAIMNGTFLEKHLTLFLKLRQVISAAGIQFQYFTNFFYDVDYILYICVGHGVSFFKYFLYKDYAPYGSKKFDKILIPPSNLLILVAKKFGWKDENIIKINLPRWDRFNDDKEKGFLLFNDNKKINNNSILLTL